MQCKQWLAAGAAVLMAALSGGCGGSEDPKPATFQVRVTAAGIIEPVSLRLEHSGGTEEVVSVNQDGELAFASELADGAAFAVTFAADAGDCVLADATGVIAQGSARVALTCPMLSDVQLVAARAPMLAFAGTTLSYEADVSLMAEVISVLATATRSDIEITVAETAVASGEPSPPLPLALGANEIALIARHPPSGASLQYTLTVHRAAAIAQYAYGKASNTDANDYFGSSVALSAAGDTLAVGAPFESGSATGINGDEANDAAPLSGAVYVFTRVGETWSQQAYVKASNTDSDDDFGTSVALSANGDTLAVGAPDESSGATGVNGNQADESAFFSGAVYVFTRTDETWSQQAYVKASNTDINDGFGSSVALSATGDTLAVGAEQEDSSATGIDGNQADDSALDSGAVYVFTQTGETWSQQAYVKASNTGANDYFGRSVALSATGDTLAVSTFDEDSSATGIGGDQANDAAPGSGAVYVFARTGETWSQQAYIKASNASTSDRFGSRVALSASGDTLAVGAFGESSSATGIGGDQANDAAPGSGAVYVFARTGETWSQQAYIKASNTGADDFFGMSVALSASGDTLAVGAYQEDSQATGIDGNEADDSADGSGAVYVFARTDETWSQLAYIKASNTDASDTFGQLIALSGTGDTLVVAAKDEDSQATGIGGDEADNSAEASGAVYLFY